MAKLNQKQIEAIEDDGLVVTVIAGAGSGKTTVLTKRISYLYRVKKVNPENVLAITFTNKAANEMKERLQEMEGPYASLSWIMTFHAFAVRILRANAQNLKHFDENFVIVDTEDQLKILKNIITELELSEEIKPKAASFAISKAKSFAGNLYEVEYAVDFEFLEIYQRYETYLKEHNALDFDDLLLYAHELLKMKSIQEKYNQKFKYILVDEFQDTSLIQSNILKLLFNKVTNMFFVGDIDQSIYSWRGATVENMLAIKSQYGSESLIKLEQNYRSTPEILKVANDLISYNEERIDKKLWTDASAGEKVIYSSFHNGFRETDYVIGEVDRLIDSGEDLSEIAILYRSNYQSRKLEEQLVKRQIPYQIYGGIRFYERAEIKDMIAYLRIILNPLDEIALLRVINVPKRKVGEKTIATLRMLMEVEKISLFDACKQHGSKSLGEFVKLIESYQENITTNFETEFPKLIEDLKYKQHWLGIDDISKVDERMQNVNEFKEAIIYELANGKSLREYLNDLAIFTEKEDVNVDAVVLSTIHGVKGLEFDNVFMIGLNEDVFPNARCKNSLQELEEERRLCYVGVTRARKRLQLTSYRFGFNQIPQPVSQFIGEMELEEDEIDIFDFVI